MNMSPSGRVSAAVRLAQLCSQQQHAPLRALHRLDQHLVQPGPVLQRQAQAVLCQSRRACTAIGSSTSLSGQNTNWLLKGRRPVPKAHAATRISVALGTLARTSLGYSWCTGSLSADCSP